MNDKLLRVSDDVVWWPQTPTTVRGRVAVVTVSYNTRELTAFLLWSLRTIVTWPDLEIVVVDNGSRDGSPQFLVEAARAGTCTLLANDDNRQHGPGLDQGISHLAARPGPQPEWIWVLDSDVVATSPDALAAAVATAREHSAAIVGEPQIDQWHADGRFGLFSMLIDPAVVWNERVGPFTDGGDPSFELLTSAARQDVPMAAFPFTAAGHVIHRGRGTLAAVHEGEERDHPLYAWAQTHHDAHYAEVPGADQRYQALLRRFREEVTVG